MRRLALSAVVCMLPVILHAQDAISGCVRDSLGMPVVAASVLLYADSLQTPPMKGYAVTGNDGCFSIGKAHKGDGWLQVKCLGYADRVVHVSGSNGSGIMVTLKPDGRTLGEVIVKGTFSGIKVSGDTVKFDTDHFRNGFESSVGDILSKLPGVSVSEGGNVSYGGKAVGTLLVDGKDVFTGSSDGLVIRNMPADNVTGAEIIRNYRGADLSDGFSQNGKTALNIKTKGLGKVSGYADGNGGHESKYNIKSFTLGTDGRYSLTAILSGNNTGTPVFSISDYLSRIASGASQRQDGTGLRLSGMEAAMLYRPENLCKDMGNVATLDARYKASDKLDISGNVTVSNSDMYGKTTREETYLSEGLQASNSSESRRRGHFITAGIGAGWKPEANVQLLTDMKVKLTGMDDGNDAHSDGAGKTDYSQRDKFDNLDINGSLALNITSGIGLFYVNGDISFSRKTLDFNLNTDTALLPIDYGHAENGSGYYLYDNRKTRGIRMSAAAGYSRNFSESYNLSTALSYRHKGNTLRLTRMQEPSEEERLTLNEYAASISLKKKKGAFRFNIGSKIQLEHNRHSAGFRNSRVRIYPAAGAEYVFTPTRRLSVTAERSNEDLEPEKMSGIRLVSNHNEMTMPSRLTTPYQTYSRLFMSYTDYNIATQTYITVFANMQKSRDAATAHVTQEGTVSTVTYDNDGHSDNIYAIANVEKRFAGVPVGVKANVSFNGMKYSSTVNDITNITKIRSLKSTVSISSNFRSALNGELTAGYSHDRNEIDGADADCDIDGINVCGRLMLRTGIWKFSAGCEYQRTISGADSRKRFDIGFMTECKIKAITLRLSAENILNMKRKEWLGTVVTPYYYAVERYSRMPGHIMLGVRWNY